VRIVGGWLAVELFSKAKINHVLFTVNRKKFQVDEKIQLTSLVCNNRIPKKSHFTPPKKLQKFLNQVFGKNFLLRKILKCYFTILIINKICSSITNLIFND
jgi:hypothetical protein